MKNKEMNLVEFKDAFERGDFNKRDRNTQIEAGWYDWFCNTSTLAEKTERLGSRVLSIVDSPRFDKSSVYVFFKNNCPCVGPLYDQFSICDIKTGDVLFCCQHLEKGSHGCSRAHWEIYSRDLGFSKPAVNGTWNDVKKWFNEGEVR